MKKLNRYFIILGVLIVILMLFFFIYNIKILKYFQREDFVFQFVKFLDLFRDGRNDINYVFIVVMRIFKGGQKVLLVILVNDVFLLFIFSWLCNIQGMGIYNQVLFIIGDNESVMKINQKWLEVIVIQIDGVYLGNQEYSYVGYVELMVRRLEVFLEILEKNILIFLFEVDCIWIINLFNNI